MALQVSYFQKVFRFRFRVRTSRGEMPNRVSWFIKISRTSDTSRFGIGEAAPLPGLSMDGAVHFEDTLCRFVRSFNERKIDEDTPSTTIEAIRHLLEEHIEQVVGYPSLLFAFEVALLDLANGGRRIVFKNKFAKGTPIPINGLIWMDNATVMWQSVQAKVKAGFKCLKVKIGGLDFEQECRLLWRIRQRYPAQDIMLRLDANGSFGATDVHYKMKELSRFAIHSIEQPLPPGSTYMAGICARPLIAVALDEELIGVRETKEKEQLLRRLKPQFIILKPTLHGGLSGCKEWIQVAQQLGIDWWATSALESNIGLNAIAQFVANFESHSIQGLGTGSIYENNFGSPLCVEQGVLYHTRAGRWEI